MGTAYRRSWTTHRTVALAELAVSPNGPVYSRLCDRRITLTTFRSTSAMQTRFVERCIASKRRKDDSPRLSLGTPAIADHETSRVAS
jgi:hypothetical protein